MAIKNDIDIEKLIAEAKKVGATNVGISDNQVIVAWESKKRVWEKDREGKWVEVES